MVVEKRAEEPGTPGLEAVEKEFVMVRLPEVLGKSTSGYGPWPRRKWASLPVREFKCAIAHRCLAAWGAGPPQLHADQSVLVLTDHWLLGDPWRSADQ